MTKETKLAVAGVALILLSVVSAVGPVMGAAPTVDTETTDTATTTDLNDGATVLGFTANSSQNISTLQASYDSQNPGVRILDPSRGNVTLNSFDSADMVQTNGSGPYYYNLTMDEGDFRYAETDALANKTMYLQLVNNTQSDDPDLSNISITLEETAGRTVRVVGDTTSGLEMTQSYSIGSFSLPYFSSSVADFSADGVPTADNGSVVIHAQNSTLTDEIGGLSLDSSSLITGMSARINGELVPFYTKGNAPDDVEGMYAVAKPDANDVVIKNTDGENLDVGLSTSGVGILSSLAARLVGDYSFLSLGLSGVGFGSGMGLLLFGSLGRRRTEA